MYTLHLNPALDIHPTGTDATAQQQMPFTVVSLYSFRTNIKSLNDTLLPRADCRSQGLQRTPKAPKDRGPLHTTAQATAHRDPGTKHPQTQAQTTCKCFHVAPEISTEGAEEAMMLGNATATCCCYPLTMTMAMTAMLVENAMQHQLCKNLLLP